ncbi:MAG TPA: hypothetical protein VKZ18_04215 [Polyangia bacterium]|nr:hypothetical protein [Polyangia bacterium]
MTNETRTETTAADPDPKRIDDSTWLKLGGAGFLALSAGFLWRDLTLPPAALMLVAAGLATLATLFRLPRRWPLVAPAAVLLTALAGGGWFLADKNPLLLPALGTALVAGIVGVVQVEHAEAWPGSALPGRVAWYAAGAAFLVATWAFYFHFLTTGIAADSVARRLVPTIVWLAVGLGLFVAGGGRGQRASVQVGGALAGLALAKAVAYDTTHLSGPLRVAVLGAVGALLLTGGQTLARAAGPRRAAKGGSAKEAS